MKTRFNQSYEDDSTPSWEVARRYREVVEQENHDGDLALIHYRGGELEFLLGKDYCLSDDAGDRATGADILGQLGWSDKTYLDESVSILMKLLDDQNSICCLLCCGCSWTSVIGVGGSGFNPTHG